MKYLSIFLITIFSFIFTLNAQSPFKLYVQTFPSSCQQDYSNGKAWVYVSGGIPPYTYLWSNNSTSDLLTDLKSGNYTVTVTDNIGQKIVESVEVEKSNELSIDYKDFKYVNCDGSPSGGVTLLPTGGIAPYSFIWDDVNKTTSAILSNAVEKSYSVTITDAKGCTATRTLLFQKLLNVEVEVKNVTCKGKGSLKVKSIVGGKAPYSFLWSNGQTTADINNLEAGSYDLEIKDVNGCYFKKSYYIGKEPSDFFIYTIEYPNSCTQKNGIIEIYDYYKKIKSYLWNNGATTGRVENLVSNTYSVTVTDVNGCTNSKTYDLYINQNEANIKVEVPCNAVQGTATAEFSNGEAPFSYLWSNGSTNQSINFGKDEYISLKIKDKNNCISGDYIGSTNYFLSDELVLYFLNNYKYPNKNICNNLYPKVFNGVAPYTYIWSNGATTSSLDMTKLDYKNYSVTVTDSKGCAGVKNLFIYPSNYSFYNEFEKKICGNSAAYLNNCNLQDYKFKWSNGGTGNFQKNLAKGNYFVTITNIAKKVNFYDTIRIKTDSVCLDLLPVFDKKINLDINIYPNPSNDIVNFEFDSIENQNYWIRIFNIAGKEVHRAKVSNSLYQFSRNNLQQGIYIYQILNKNELLKSGKIIFIDN